ncbi:MAG TPA: four helix bundle protein [Kofleriaceae bacterium]|nr:four helix bundle protein [Kofleriaceae bacterium]
MLRIYPVCLCMVREVRPLADAIARFDRDHARQLRRSALSVPLNVAEGSGSSGGTRRARYESALGSARETVANLEAACAVGYLEEIDPALRNRFDHIIGTLVKLVH